jgi:hypothetical protein
MNLYMLGAVACVAVWIYLAFVAAIPNGWVHVPLVVAVILLARGIVIGKSN